MTAIYKRELRSYFHNVIGFVFLAFLLLAAGIFSVVFHVLLQSSRFEDTLYYMQLAFLIAVPLLTMRAMTEERRSHTDQLLYALPLPLSKIVLGKYFAMVTVLGIGCGIIAIYPLILAMFGLSGLGSAYATLLGLFLLGAALIALCMFLSSLTESQVIAMILCVVGALALFLADTFASALAGMGALVSLILLLLLAVLICVIVFFASRHNLALTGIAAALTILPQIVVYCVHASAYEGLLYRVITAVSLFSRYSLFCNGVFKWTTMVYDASFAAFFLFLTWAVMEKRRRA